MRVLSCSRITLEASVGMSWRRSREASEEVGLVQGTNDEAGLALGPWEEGMMREWRRKKQQNLADDSVGTY